MISPWDGCRYRLVETELEGVLRTAPVVPDDGEACRQSSGEAASEGFELPLSEDRGWMGMTYRGLRSVRGRARLRLVASWGRPTGRLLDLGGHDGFFAALAAKRGWRAVVLEPDDTARGVARERGLEAVAQLKDLRGRAFDAITLWHVLEHIDEAEALLRDLGALLEPGGRLFVTCPNHASADARHYGASWAAWDVPRHRWHFTAQGLQQWFLRRGWRVLALRRSWWDAFYVSLLSERRARTGDTAGTGWRAAGRAARVATWSTLAGVRTGETSAVTLVVEPAQQARDHEPLGCAP